MMQKHLPLEEVRRRDAAGEPPDHLLEVFADMGLFRLVMSEKEGGLGGSWEQLSIIQERLGYHATMAALLFNKSVSVIFSAVMPRSVMFCTSVWEIG